jgi:hypothetical protein
VKTITYVVAGLGHVGRVNLEMAKYVYDLKKAILNQEECNCKSKRIKLFLARHDDGTWLQESDSAVHVMESDGEIPQTIKDMMMNVLKWHIPCTVNQGWTVGTVHFEPFPDWLVHLRWL